MKRRSQLVGILTSVAVLFLFMALVGSPAQLQAQSIQVLSANPPTAEQGTVNLNVLIKGKGFKRGAIAKFLVTGTTDTGGVRVNSTSYVRSTDLTANIDVTDTAVLSKYDIQVMNSDGRGGKGTELFTVQKKGGTACVAPPTFPTGCFDSPGGCMDSTFGLDHTGKVTAPPDLEIYGIAIQKFGTTDERIVGVGPLKPGATADRLWTVVRYRADNGELDASFGTGGIVQTNFVGNGGVPYAVVIQADNRIVVAGVGSYARNQAAATPTVARYNLNGSLDTTFGSGGVVPLPYAVGSAYALTLQPDGKGGENIVIAGGYYDQLTVTRLTSNGALDNSFNGTGQFTYPSFRSGHAVAMQPVGTEKRIVVAAWVPFSTPDGTYRASALLRFTSTGTLDTSFGDSNSGIVVTHFGPTDIDSYTALLVDSGNRLVATGEAYDPAVGHSRVLAARFTPDGRLDTSFGTSGSVKIDPQDPSESPTAIALQLDGKILIAGVGMEPGSYFTIWRLNDDGSPDISFGTNGRVTVDFGTTHAPGHAIALQSDGKFVTAGHMQYGDVSLNCIAAAVARLYQ